LRARKARRDPERFEADPATQGDSSLADNLAAKVPKKLHDLQRLWLIEATKYNVLPLDDQAGERMNPDLAGRPVPIHGNTQILFDSCSIQEWVARPSDSRSSIEFQSPSLFLHCSCPQLKLGNGNPASGWRRRLPFDRKARRGPRAASRDHIKVADFVNFAEVGLYPVSSQSHTSDRIQPEPPAVAEGDLILMIVRDGTLSLIADQ
jgi:hypothetical protein